MKLMLYIKISCLGGGGDLILVKQEINPRGLVYVTTVPLSRLAVLKLILKPLTVITREVTRTVFVKKWGGKLINLVIAYKIRHTRPYS